MTKQQLIEWLGDKERRFKYEKWFWIVMLLPNQIWLGNFVKWVSFLSIYALIITAGGAQEAAKAAKEAKNE